MNGSIMCCPLFLKEPKVAGCREKSLKYPPSRAPPDPTTRRAPVDPGKKPELPRIDVGGRSCKKTIHLTWQGLRRPAAQTYSEVLVVGQDGGWRVGTHKLVSPLL
ncbi:hypothetical protein DPEC_G00140080 [Dallia pectoralis]|uniref:Uncharacterized protein n=1 Tax=Dallia pectoralis TaxID=75939 RepID=A0ACC2GMC6_DALPE|nr:hypothetical protein DPEC_G00140080 [Dallia pectoralis]